jgi:hypothetical protein
VQATEQRPVGVDANECFARRNTPSSLSNWRRGDHARWRPPASAWPRTRSLARRPGGRLPCHRCNREGNANASAEAIVGSDDRRHIKGAALDVQHALVDDASSSGAGAVAAFAAQHASPPSVAGLLLRRGIGVARSETSGSKSSRPRAARFPRDEGRCEWEMQAGRRNQDRRSRRGRISASAARSCVESVLALIFISQLSLSMPGSRRRSCRCGSPDLLLSALPQSRR